MRIEPRYPRWCVLLLLVLCCGPVFARCADEGTPPFDVQQLLKDPDHSDIPWKFAIYGPHLTMQQRYILGVYAEIEGSRLRTPAEELHFLLKVADEKNRWIAEKYTRVKVTRRQDEPDDVSYSCGFYLRPGRYTVALILYDAALNKGNVRRKRVDAALLNRDPLPQLNRLLPEVEFTSESPRDYASRLPGVTNHIDDFLTLSSIDDFVAAGSGHRQDSALGKGTEWLPVNNSRPLAVDLVVNLSSDYDSVPSLTGVRSFVKSSDLVRMASVLSHMRLNKGCIRVTVTDAQRMETLFDKKNSSDFDWQSAAELVSKRSAATINASLLSLQDKASHYIQEKFSEIIQNDGCAPAGESPLKIIILVSRDITFLGEHRDIEQVPAPNPGSLRFFYFRATDGIYRDDDLLRMLKQVKPQQFVVQDSYKFRKSLASLITALEKVK